MWSQRCICACHQARHNKSRPEHCCGLTYCLSIGSLQNKFYCFMKELKPTIICFCLYGYPIPQRAWDQLTETLHSIACPGQLTHPFELSFFRPRLYRFWHASHWCRQCRAVRLQNILGASSPISGVLLSIVESARYSNFTANVTAQGFWRDALECNHLAFAQA